jgi:hypothetical protein
MMARQKAFAAMSGAGSVSPSAGLTAYQDGPQIWVRWNNRLMASYRAHRSQKYPYMYPLTGPITGQSLTGETALPWPHHRSLWFACDRVNDHNFWQEELEKGQILSTGLRLGKVDASQVEINDQCEWRRPGGPLVMRDQRSIRLRRAGDNAWCMDWNIDWTAVQDVRIEKTNHSLFALRSASDLAPVEQGRLVNAEGLAGEKATYGIRSRWCALSRGQATAPGGLIEGIALMDHPDNPWSPCPWFTRDYGFISPTPFNFMERPWELPAQRSVRVRYRVVWYAGVPAGERLEDFYQDWLKETRTVK